jgi:hypothetical protein
MRWIAVVVVGMLGLPDCKSRSSASVTLPPIPDDAAGIFDKMHRGGMRR